MKGWVVVVRGGEIKIEEMPCPWSDGHLGKALRTQYSRYWVNAVDELGAFNEYLKLTKLEKELEQ